MIEPCRYCGALGPCCETSLAREKTATSLARIVKRQEQRIRDLERDSAVLPDLVTQLNRTHDSMVDWAHANPEDPATMEVLREATVINILIRRAEKKP